LKIMLFSHLFYLVMQNERLFQEHWRTEMTAVIALKLKYLQERTFSFKQLCLIILKK
jgi:hypothetical protein